MSGESTGEGGGEEGEHEGLEVDREPEQLVQELLHVGFVRLLLHPALWKKGTGRLELYIYV